MRHTNGNMGFCIALSDLDKAVVSERRKNKFGQVQEYSSDEVDPVLEDVANPTNAQWIADAQRKGKIVKSPNVKSVDGEQFYVIPFDLSLVDGEIDDWKLDGVGKSAPYFFIGSISEVTNGVSEGSYAFEWDGD